MMINPHVESTTNYWPNSQQLKDHLSLPLTLSLQPFGHEYPISAIDPEQISQYRCQSCKAFINQLCFIRSDHEYDCSLCGCTNYLQKPIDIRMNQLNSLSYKLKAPSRQRLLSTKDRLAVFVLDLANHGPETKEYLLYSVYIIKEFLKNLHENQISMNICLIGFDSAIHRFSVNSPEGFPQRSISYGHLEQGDDIYFPQIQQQIGNSIANYQNFNIILEDLENEIKNDQLRCGKGEALLGALEIGLRLSSGYSGKLILVSGIRQQIPQFKQRMNRYLYDQVQKHSFLTNKKECLKGELQKYLQNSQMSLSFFFINATYISNMPFHIMAKHSNGQLRHYFPNQSLLFFQDFKKNVETLLDEQTGYESLLKVRYSTGVKLVGMFGNFRSTKVSDQIQLLTCPTNRQYLFEFHIQGRVSSEFVVIQFSSLYTSLRGERYFIIQTHSIKITDSPQVVVENIDYINVNISYIRGVVHNLDSSGNLRNLQLAIQQRCRKHIIALKQLSKDDLSENKYHLKPQLSKKVRPYIIITFLMMKHFLLNQNYDNPLHFDLNTEIRSKIATLQNSINIIWPLVYTVGEDGWEMAELQQQYIPKASVAIFIDRCDQYYCYLINPKLQAHLKTANAKDILAEMIEKDESLAQVKRITESIKQSKHITYLDILPLEELKELKVLDMQGPFGFDKFINLLMSD